MIISTIDSCQLVDVWFMFNFEWLHLTWMSLTWMRVNSNPRPAARVDTKATSNTFQLAITAAKILFRENLNSCRYRGWILFAVNVVVVVVVVVENVVDVRMSLSTNALKY